jgi:hypothetical protein
MHQSHINLLILICFWLYLLRRSGP